LGAVHGSLRLDLAAEGDEFVGLKERIECGEGEIVLRDDTGIIASYLQGPDFRTRITKGSSDLLLLGFHAPDADQAAVNEGIGVLAEILGSVAELSSYETFTP